MNIAFLHAESLFPLSGSNLRGHAILRALADAGHRIDLVAPAASEAIPASIRHFPTSPIDRFSKGKARQHLRFARESLALRRTMRDRYDLVYAHRLASAPLGRRLARQSRAPLIADLWEVDFLEVYPFPNPLTRAFASLLAPFYERRLLREVARVIVLSEAMRAYVNRRFGVDALVSYDAADSELFHASVRHGAAVPYATTPERTGDRERPFKILFHGGIEPRDGLVEFLDVFAIVAAKTEAELVLLGRGAALAQIERRIAREPWGGRVRLGGWIGYREIPAALAEVDLAILPSLDTPMNRMVIPRKAFEYMALGIPMVATDLPVMHEQLDHETAVFVPAREPVRFADEIVKLILDPSRRARMRERLLTKAAGLTLQSEVATIVREVENAKCQMQNAKC